MPPTPEDGTLRYGEGPAPEVEAEETLPAAEDLWASLKALWAGETEPTLPPLEADPVWPLG
jgi:hypothetical protein